MAFALATTAKQTSPADSSRDSSSTHVRFYTGTIMLVKRASRRENVVMGQETSPRSKAFLAQHDHVKQMAIACGQKSVAAEKR